NPLSLDAVGLSALGFNPLGAGGEALCRRGVNGIIGPGRRAGKTQLAGRRRRCGGRNDRHRDRRGGLGSGIRPRNDGGGLIGLPVGAVIVVVAELRGEPVDAEGVFVVSVAMVGHQLSPRSSSPMAAKYGYPAASMTSRAPVLRSTTTATPAMMAPTLSSASM